MKSGLRIGLTGGIASGKTTVTGMFRSLGAAVIDADEIAREITMPGGPAYKDIISLFGDRIVDDNGYLRRDLIKEIIFSDKGLKQRLEDIIHPRIHDEMEALASNDYPYCILSIPLLLESKDDYRLDHTLVIDVSEKEQLERMMKRDKVSKELALSIIRSQVTRERRLAAADDVIENSSDLSNLKNQVNILHKKYIDLASAYESNQALS